MFGRGGRGSASKSISAHKQPAKATRKSPQSGRLRAGADTAQIISRLRRSGEYRSPPKRSGHVVAASWGFSGGWVGGRSEYKKACEADTTQQRVYGHQPTARVASRVCLPIGRLGGWAEGAINKPAKQTPPTSARTGTQPAARVASCICLPIGRLGGWAEGAINKPAKQTPPNKRPNGHPTSRSCCYLPTDRLGGWAEGAKARAKERLQTNRPRKAAESSNDWKDHGFETPARKP